MKKRLDPDESPESYQIHPQLQRMESHNRRLRKSALQTAHDLIHISFLLRTASAAPCRHPRSLIGFRWF